MASDQYRKIATAPVMLLVPGNDDARSRQWLGDWEASFPQARPVDLGLWNRPHRNTWVNKLNLAIHRAERPVIVIAEGLACVAVAWWAEYERPGADGPVVGALLIDPPDVDRPGLDPRLAALSSVPRTALPFAACVLASGSRGAMDLRTVRRLAVEWRCSFDTYGGQSVPSVPSPSPVQSLGQRFLSGLIGGWD